VKALTVLVAAALLAACSQTEVRPGQDGATSACTALTGRLPPKVLDRPRHDLEVAGAAAWGNPAIVLRCGVPPTGPTSAPCLEVDGLDWTFTETENAFRFVTYGRLPAVELRIPVEVGRTNAHGALVDLAPAVRALEKTAACV
jgi:hypothetical protein